jgi:diguanylate cyclase (GGDEF)-like protein
VEDALFRLVTLFERNAVAPDHVTLETLLRTSRAREEQLSYLASHDPLTGVLNRRGLELEALSEAGRSRRSGATLAALLIDCDDFKRVNARLGQSGGDRALREMAMRMEGALRPTDRSGRIGGDEFLVLLPDTRLAEARCVAERIRTEIATLEFASSGGPVALTVSVGVVALPDDVTSLERVVSLADAPLRRSKALGKNHVYALTDSAVVEARNGEDSAQSPRLSGLRVVVRPVVRIGDRRTVAWKLDALDEFGRSSDELEPRASPNALAGSEALDLERLRLCLEHCAGSGDGCEWRVRLAPATLLERRSRDVVMGLLGANVGHPVCLEFSEQQLVGDPGDFAAARLSLRDAGARMALIDVGVGRAALEALIVLAPDVAELSASFARGAVNDMLRERTLGRLARLVRGLDCELDIAGVDDEHVLNCARTAGAEYAVGAMWDAALPASSEKIDGWPRSSRLTGRATN